MLSTFYRQLTRLGRSASGASLNLRWAQSAAAGNWKLGSGIWNGKLAIRSGSDNSLWWFATFWLGGQAFYTFDNRTGALVLIVVQ